MTIVTTEVLPDQGPLVLRVDGYIIPEESYIIHTSVFDKGYRRQMAPIGPVNFKKQNEALGSYDPLRDRAFMSFV